MIGFYKTLKGTEQQISEINYEQLCKSRKDVFESIPDDKPVKMYFDADYVFYDGRFEDFNPKVADEVLRLNKLYLSKSLIAKTGIEPEFAVAESHSSKRVKNGKEVWGYSFHITIPNIVCYKNAQKKFTEDLNNAIIEDQKYDSNEITEDRYTDYLYGLESDFKPFDTSVYNSGKQKLRTVYSSKDGEDRPFNIQEGDFEKMVVSGFIADNVVHYTPVLIEKDTPTVYEPKTVIRHDPNIEIKDDADCVNLFNKLSIEKEKMSDMLFVKIAFEKGMLFSRAKDTEKWMATSMFLKGYFGDNNETKALFENFSKLCASKYDSAENLRKWDDFVTNEKYDNFGIFVNWCKEDNKVKCKEIGIEIKNAQKIENEKNREQQKLENEKKKEERRIENEKKKQLLIKSREQMIELKNRTKADLELQKEKKKEANEELKSMLIQLTLNEKEKNNAKKEEDRIRKEKDRIKKEETKRILDQDKKSKLENSEKGAKLFEEMSAKFELEHTKIINGSIYIKQVEDRVVFMSRRDMTTSYEHIQCGYNILNQPVSFIEKWMVNNKSINVKDTMDIYPDVENCPPNVFNLWRPFEMEKYKTPYQQHNDELKIILNHILILCGNDNAMYNYFIGWISKMMQQPHIKLTCIVLISKQGAGKGTLMKLFSKMLGKNKTYEPTNPSRDVWGNFNELMTDAFLVNINELEYNDAKKGESQFKALITDPNITINPKGQKPIWVKSHHHFIITTNKENPIPIEKGNRRFVVVKSSDEKCKDADYFTQIHEIMENIDVIRTAYDYFKNYDISDYDDTKFPVTEYLEDLMMLNTCAPELWLKDFTAENIEQNTIELLGGEIFARFSLWCNTNNVVYDTNPIKLALKIKNLSINGIEKGRETKKGNTKIFDIQKMKKHFNLGCLVEL